MKITKKELQELIKEEAIKFKRALELKKELAEVQKQLDEVYAGDVYGSEKQGGVHTGQRKPVFKKKGDALVEDEIEDTETIEEVNGAETSEEDVVEECELTSEEDEECELSSEEGEEENIFENLDEPIEGESVAQKTKKPNVDDGMKKDNHVKENEEKDAMLKEEQDRMKKLAGIL